mmetsp:Transcript_75085/g.242921  ORF Transcript_75085/g.242921 Transcript_75085/m.242921 type:complete len:241 (+) Transcript_75085:431-1153(+)
MACWRSIIQGDRLIAASRESTASRASPGGASPQASEAQVFELVVLVGFGSLGLKLAGQHPGAVRINSVDPNSWGAAKGLQANDRLLMANGIEVDELVDQEFMKVMQTRPLTLQISRGGPVVSRAGSGVTLPEGRQLQEIRRMFSELKVAHEELQRKYDALQAAHHNLMVENQEVERQAEEADKKSGKSWFGRSKGSSIPSSPSSGLRGASPTPSSPPGSPASRQEVGPRTSPAPTQHRRR